MKTLLLITAYFVGCFNTGYYLTRFLTKKDIRSVGSSVTGATNVSRVLGKKGFAITFLGDVLKVIGIILISNHFFNNSLVTYGVIFFTFIGHIFPIQLKFKGGKGISVYLGGLIMINYFYILFLIAGLILPYIITKNFTISGLISLLLLPLVIYFFNKNIYDIIFVSIINIMVLFTHRKNIYSFINKK